MSTTLPDAYIAAFATRCDVMRGPGMQALDEPGLRGLITPDGDPRTRLLVVDDRAYARLADYTIHRDAHPAGAYAWVRLLESDEDPRWGLGRRVGLNAASCA